MSWKRIRKRFKKIGRKVLKVHAKVGKVVRPVGAAAATALLGPGGGAAFLAITHYPQQYAAAAGARGDGIKGHAARTYGRSVAQRSLKYGIYGAGAGLLGAVAVGGLGAAPLGLVGQPAIGGSGAGVLGMSNPFMASPAVTTTGLETAVTSLGSAKATEGGLAAKGLESAVFGLDASPAAAGGGSTLASAVGVAGAAAGLLGQLNAVQGGALGSESGGGGGGGGGFWDSFYPRDSQDGEGGNGMLIVALVIGGFLLLS